MFPKELFWRPGLLTSCQKLLHWGRGGGVTRNWPDVRTLELWPIHYHWSITHYAPSSHVYCDHVTPEHTGSLTCDYGGMAPASVSGPLVSLVTMSCYSLFTSELGSHRLCSGRGNVRGLLQCYNTAGVTWPTAVTELSNSEIMSATSNIRSPVSSSTEWQFECSIEKQ